MTVAPDQPTRSHHHTVVRDGDVLLDIAACSDRGPVRQENQDAWSIHPLPEADNGAVVILADGMGGHADGAVASYLAVTAATDRIRSAPDPHAATGQAVADANASIRQRRAERGGPMSGTTLVVAVISRGRVTLANVGDSRAYLLRGGEAKQLTQDHSWAAEQVRAGLMTADVAARHAQRNLLTRALTGDAVDPDQFTVELVAGDTLLLCSDGVWDALGAGGIGDALPASVSLSEAADGAVSRAIATGATDNVTVVACRVTALGGDASVPGEPRSTVPAPPAAAP